MATTIGNSQTALSVSRNMKRVDQFLWVDRRARVICGARKIVLLVSTTDYPWGSPCWPAEPVELADLSAQPLDSLRLFFAWLAQAPIYGAHVWSRARYKEIRKERLHKGKKWDEVLPDPIVRWANDRLASLSEGECCVDNYRVAKKGNTGQLRRYKSQKAFGCCGFCDVEEKGPDGAIYLLGFNYGH